MYDPLVDKQLRPFQGYPPSYWHQQTSKRENFAPLSNNLDTEVAIIGGGYTGLSAALTLAQHGVSCVLLEANEIGWGCSSRNAGFILPGCGRLDYAGIAAKYGSATAEATISEYYAALDTVHEFIGSNDVQRTQGGYLKIAHNRAFAQKMQSAWRALPPQWQSQYRWLGAATISNSFIPGYRSFGGLYREAGQGLNPFKLVLALAGTARQNMIPIFCNSPVQRWQKQQNKHHLLCNQHSVQAEKVILASNAYGLRQLSQVSYKQFPVLSSVLVTAPLPAKLVAKWRAGLMAMDTRSLKYYYRLLPDKRLLFGGRGAITGKQANTGRSQNHLRKALHQYFPELTDIAVEYFWSGWVSVSADDLPHICRDGEDPSLYYSTGYCGSGVAFACHAGKRLAQLVVGENWQNQDAVIYQKPIPAFPFTPFRRIGLRAYYAWQRGLDALGR